MHLFSFIAALGKQNHNLLNSSSSSFGPWVVFSRLHSSQDCHCSTGVVQSHLWKEIRHGGRAARLIVERLDNGLTVIVKTVPNRVVTIDAWVNTGSANESPGLNGISHFLEHMLFKGTPKYGPGELDKAIMNVGGVWNAGTSKDFTHYYVTVATPFFETALDAISDMIQHALIDPGEFDREKQVILEEYRRKQDSPIGLLYDELYDLTFAAGPYRHTVLGSFESISALERDAMVSYYRHYYTPSNMVVIIAGDVDPEPIMRHVRHAFVGFGTGAPAPAYTPHKPDKSHFRSGETRAIPKDVNESYMALSFPGPAIVDESEVHALDIASTILAEGRSSRLYRRMKEELRLVDSISAGSPTHRYPGMFYVLATLSRDKVDEARMMAVELLRQAAETPPGDQEMSKARRIITNQFCFSTETNTGQSSTIGYYFTLTGSTTFLEHYLDRLNAVTAEQVAQVVAKYLVGEPNMVLVEPAHGNAAKGQD